MTLPVAFSTLEFVQVQQEIAMPPEAPTDFAVGLHLSEKHGVIFMVTKACSDSCGENCLQTPFVMLMMHYSASFTSLASPNRFFDAFLMLS